MYKNILFDMGNVIMDFSPDHILSQFTQDVKLINFLKHKIFYTKIWALADEGLAGNDDIYNHAIQGVDEKYHSIIKKAIERWFDFKMEDMAMFRLIEKLKHKGYKLYLCSNAAKTFHLYEHKLESFKLLDGKVVSADIQMVKPNKNYFDYVLTAYNLKPEECFFIDDLAANIKGAYDCGIDGYQYNGHVHLLEEYLMRVGIL